MDDQMMVGGGDSLADAQEQLEPLAQIDLCSVGINGRSFHIFHDQIRPAALGVAGIDHGDNGRGIQVCEELTFPEKTVAPCGAMFVDAEELDGYLLFNLAIGSLGRINWRDATRA